jgi:MFS family permease
VIVGFFSAGCFPSAYHFFPLWVPASEKTLLVPLVVAGCYVGEIIGFPICGLLVKASLSDSATGWPLLFFFFGALGVLWVPFWLYMAYESPDTHPYITESEREYIREGEIPYLLMPYLRHRI